MSCHCIVFIRIVEYSMLEVFCGSDHFTNYYYSHSSLWAADSFYPQTDQSACGISLYKYSFLNAPRVNNLDDPRRASDPPSMSKYSVLQTQRTLSDAMLRSFFLFLDDTVKQKSIKGERKKYVSSSSLVLALSSPQVAHKGSYCLQFPSCEVCLPVQEISLRV